MGGVSVYKSEHIKHVRASSACNHGLAWIDLKRPVEKAAEASEGICSVRSRNE